MIGKYGIKLSGLKMESVEFLGDFCPAGYFRGRSL